VKPDKHYGQRHYEHCAKKYEFSGELKKYKCIFIDSITVASRICLDYAKSTADLTRNGKPDIRSAYGTMATEMLVWVNHFQHFEGVDVVFIGGLDQKLDDSNHVVYSPQVEGSKVAAELPGILDEVITMIQAPGIPAKPGSTMGQRRFVCQTLNPEGYPAKDRSGRLNVFEEAHLGKLLSKIKGLEDSTDSLTQIVDRINKEKKS
jgi:hypothetical protein